MHISIELVPRSYEALAQEASDAINYGPKLWGFNIPDLLRFPLRSWEAARYLQPLSGVKNVPHLRSSDFKPEEALLLAQQLYADGFKELIIIKGDPPQDMSRISYNTTPVQLIRLFKKHLPDMQVHAALDQYRGNVQAELEYARQKIDAGADGLFTQPFFDIRLMDIYAEQIEQVPIFWGASPVLSDSSRSYWETRNRAYFPKDFAPTMEWNADFAKKLIEHAQAAGGHVYLMPIRVKISAYLGAIFGTAQ